MNARLFMATAVVALASVSATRLSAQSLEVKPIGILHMDAAVYMGDQRSLFRDGVALPEARIGADAKFGDWKVRALVGFANNKVAVRDVYAQYNFTPHNYLRVGHFVHQFGYQNSTGAYEKPTMIAPGSETVFNTAQRLGVAFVHTDSVAFFSGSLYTPDDMLNKSFGSDKGKTNRQSLGLKFRSAVHPLTDSEKIIAQIGLSGLFETPHAEASTTNYYGDTKYFNLSLPFPTKVNNVVDEEVTVDYARNRWEISPDLLLGHGRLALESQYYFTRINRSKGMGNYEAKGFYVNARGILIGGNYQYAPALAGLATPAPKTLEGILTYNYTNLGKDSFYYTGSPVHDVAMVLNYYLNKYMVVRLRGGLTFRKIDDIELIGGPTRPGWTEHLGSIQARLQVIF